MLQLRDDDSFGRFGCQIVLFDITDFYLGCDSITNRLPEDCEESQPATVDFTVTSDNAETLTDAEYEEMTGWILENPDEYFPEPEPLEPDPDDYYMIGRIA